MRATRSKSFFMLPAYSASSPGGLFERRFAAGCSLALPTPAITMILTLETPEGA